MISFRFLMVNLFCSQLVVFCCEDVTGFPDDVSILSGSEKLDSISSEGEHDFSELDDKIFNPDEKDKKEYSNYYADMKRFDVFKENKRETSNFPVNFMSIYNSCEGKMNQKKCDPRTSCGGSELYEVGIPTSSSYPTCDTTGCLFDPGFIKINNHPIGEKTESPGENNGNNDNNNNNSNPSNQPFQFCCCKL